MNTTIRADIPIEMKRQIDRAIANGWFSSMNDVVTTILSIAFPQKKHHRRVTVNGFPSAMELEALRASKEPTKHDTILRTPKDIDLYIDTIMQNIAKKRHEHQNDWHVHDGIE